MSILKNMMERLCDEFYYRFDVVRVTQGKSFRGYFINTIN